jgi:hypothetical protein
VSTFKKVVELCVYLLLGAVVLAVWWNLLPSVSVRRGGALEREHFIMQWNEEIKHRSAADFVADRRSSSMTFPDAWATRPQMSAYLDPLESAHSMALFYPDRMSSLTAWFRRVTCESLRILSESLGFTPTGVWEALPAPLEKLRQLRTLLRRQKVWQSA